MATLHIRGLPGDALARIRDLARAEGRTVNAQVIQLLTTASKGVIRSLSLEEALEAARKIRRAGSATRSASSVSLLHEARRARERR